MKLLAFILACLAASVAQAQPTSVARAVLADLAKQPADAKAFVRYLWIPAPADDLEGIGAALKFAVCSTSRSPNLDRQAPVAIAADVYRIDLRALEWDSAEFAAVAKAHPYSVSLAAPTVKLQNPLILHAGWFLEQISDGKRSDAYYRLLYGARQPKTRQEFLAFWRVDTRRLLKESRELSIWIEGASGVSVQRVRTMLGWPAETGQLWETRDVLELTPDKDPIEFAGRDAPYDGQEWIISVPKISAAKQLRGAAQVYWLTNGADARVEFAPVDLVEDHTRAVRLAEIRNPVSCHACHVEGLNKPSINEFRRVLELGVKANAYDEATADRVQRLLFPIEKLVARQNEDFAAFVEACNGLTPAENVRAYLAAVQSYRSNVSLSQAAAEVGCDAHSITLAVAYARDHGRKVSERLVELASGGAIPRAAWEQFFGVVCGYVYAWEHRK